MIHRSGPVSDLAVAPDPRVGPYRVKAENGREEDLNHYIAGGHGIDGLIVLHRGRIVYEVYPRMPMQDKHLLASVTKAFVGTAVGILEDRGQGRR